MNEKYEPIKFDSWQELAKFVIDGGEVWIKNNAGNYAKLEFDGRCFNYYLNSWIENTYIKKQPTLEELIAIKPRLCWVCYKNKKFTRLIVNVDEHGFFIDDNGCTYDNARLLTDDEIKQFLNGE